MSRYGKPHRKRLLPAVRPSKYGNEPVEIGGIKFASKAEARRYGELLLLEKAGEIRNLQLQPRFPMKIDGKLICTYFGDFAYFRGNERVIEDVKGYQTREFKLKAKLFQALYPGQRLELVR